MEVPKVIFQPERMRSLITPNEEFISSCNFDLTEREIARAREDLGETEERRKTCIRELRSKLAGDKDVNYRTDEDFLLRYLRVRKFDINRAYQNIKQAYSLKKKHPEIFDLPENLASLLDLGILVCLPYVDEKGNVLFFLDFERWNPQETSNKEYLNIVAVVCDLISLNPKCQINGAIGIYDAKAISMQHPAALLKSHSIGTLSFFMENYHPWRVTNVFIVNTSRFARLCYKMLRPFLSRKISERVILLGSDFTELHQYINPVLLPKTLGGMLEVNQYSITQNVLDNIDYLKYERSFV